MDKPLSPGRWVDAIRREWRLRQLGDEAYRFLFDPAPPEEWVSIACATSGYDVEHDEILAVSAVRVAGRRVLGSERLELLLQPRQPVPPAALREHRLREQDLARGMTADEATPRLLQFIGSRPLLGYYLEFDIAMLDRLVRPAIGIGLPNEAIEVSSLYYAWEFDRLPPYQQQDHAAIDLRFAAMLAALDLPQRESPCPLDKAVLTALAFIKLRVLAG
ncbi:MAG: hypothetical protein RJA36_102 [Pseudomonadota bacterium]|jgi:DNA polymerase-3 subunit epsilon